MKSELEGAKEEILSPSHHRAVRNEVRFGDFDAFYEVHKNQI